MDWKDLTLNISYHQNFDENNMRRVQLVEQELLALPEHMSSIFIFNQLLFMVYNYSFSCMLWCPLQFSSKDDSIFLKFVLQGIHVLVTLIVIIYLSWYPMGFPHHMTFVWSKKLTISQHMIFPLQVCVGFLNH